MATDLTIKNASKEEYDRFVKIMNWDLTREKEYCANRLGYGDSENHLDQMEIEYKRFIFLICTYHDKSLPASNRFDDLWHAHILNVRKWVEFSDHVSGRLLYHNPTVSEDEDNALIPAYEQNTLKLYEHHFGSPNEFWVLTGGPSQTCCTH